MAAHGSQAPPRSALDDLDLRAALAASPDNAQLFDVVLPARSVALIVTDFEPTDDVIAGAEAVAEAVPG